MSAVLFSTWYGSCHLLHALVSSWFDYSNALCVAFKDRNFSFSHVAIHYKAVASLKSIASTLQALHWLQGTSFVQALSDLGLDPLRKCLLLCKSLLLKTMIWCCGYLQTRINATILYIIGIKSWDTLGLSPGPSGCNGICFWVDMLRIVLQGCNPKCHFSQHKALHQLKKLQKCDKALSHHSWRSIGTWECASAKLSWWGAGSYEESRGEVGVCFSGQREGRLWVFLDLDRQEAGLGYGTYAGS